MPLRYDSFLGDSGGTFVPPFMYTVDVTVPAGTVASDLADFPLYVRLSDMPSDFWDNVSFDGGNIRVANSVGTAIPFDLAFFYFEDEDGVLFVRTDLAAAMDTTVKIVCSVTDLTRKALSDLNGANDVWADYEAVTLLGADARDRTGKGVWKSVADPQLLARTVAHTFTQDPHQGGTFDGTYHYIVDTNAIYKFDASWTLVDTNATPIADTGLASVNHLGDPCNVGGKLYIPLEVYPSGPYANQHIAVFNCSDLSFDTSINISAQAHEVSSICHCPIDGRFYVTDYAVGAIHKYEMDGTYVSVFTTSPSMAGTSPQGIEFYQNAFWVSMDSTDEVVRIELDGAVSPGATGVNGYFGSEVSGNLEGIWRVGDSLYILEDPTAANSIAVQFAPHDMPLGAGGGQSRSIADTWSRIDGLASTSTFTLGATGRITSKATNNALASYAVGTAGSGVRATLSYRLSTTTMGVWDDTNVWLEPAVDFNPAITDYHRYHMIYQGTARRDLWADGTLIATDLTLTAIGGSANTLYVGVEDTTGNEEWSGFVGFVYLYPGALSGDWLAAEFANLDDAGAFYAVAEAV